MKKDAENTTKQGNEVNTMLPAEPCLNCKETIEQCACMRNICTKCGKPVGNITFTICDNCWDIEFPPKVCSRDEDCVERDKQTNDCKYKYECAYKKQTVL